MSLAGLIEAKLIGTFALFLGLLGWQWVSIRRTLRNDRRKAERHASRSVSPSSERSDRRPS